MERLIPRIREIADSIHKTEMKRKRLSEFLSSVGERADIHSTIRPSNLDNITVCGVDGGLAKKSLHGFDVILIKAAGACFSYEGGKISKVEYHPGKSPTPKADILEALSDLDFLHFSGIMRQSLEVKTCLEVLEKKSPDIILMDGSIVPHYSDRPQRISPVYKHYKSMISLFSELYRKSLERGTILAGIIEDSRGTSFSQIINKEVISKVNSPHTFEMSNLLEKTRDTNLLYWVLKKGQRSRVYRYSDKPQDHPVLRGFEDLAERIHSFYLKTAKHDRPIRVDLLAHGSDVISEADHLGSVLLAISGHHSGYGLPAPIIEADNVAKLTENEIDNFYSQILSYSGNIPSVMKLRRDQRPF